MASLLNDFSNTINDVTGSSQETQKYQDNGFIVSGSALADGNGLPSQKLKNSNLRQGKVVRNLCHWFVPDVGVIPMFINPQRMVQNNTKSISKERTKGGFIIQYWGEELMAMTLSGHTGTSGVEGLNVLYEIYRAEQYMFDGIALQMSADSSISGLDDLVSGAIGNLGGFSGALAGGLAGFSGIGNSSSSLPSDVPSLASMATGIELYYGGQVFRGYFTSFNITESSDQLGIMAYDIQFTVTQKRGYRMNFMPWHKNAFSPAIDADPELRTYGRQLYKK